MKKIGIDCRLYFQTGVGVYLRNFLHCLEKNPPANTSFYLYFLKKDLAKIKFKSSQFVIRETRSPWHSFSEQFNFLLELNHDNLDLMHFTYFSYPILYRKKFIATVHDLTPWIFKTGRASTKNDMAYNFKHMIFKEVISAQIKNSKITITPSVTVKKQIISYFGKNFADKIVAIPEGINYELEEVKESKNLKKTYGNGFFLYVGNFYPHKNVENLIKAFAKVKTEKKLILAGPKDYFSSRVGELIKTLHQEKRVIFQFNSTIGDLKYLYKNACALIHPSLSEGFGLPIVESIYFNLPILASDIEIFNELLDGKYIKFDPLNVEDIANKINNFIGNEPKIHYGNLIAKFSFEKMTERIVNIYNQVLG